MNDLLKKVPQTKLLYITPETITLSSNTIKSLKSLYLRDLLSLIVVDEAHCISTWGHDFRSSYRKLSTLRSLFPKTPIMVSHNIHHFNLLFIINFYRPLLRQQPKSIRNLLSLLLPFLLKRLISFFF